MPIPGLSVLHLADFPHSMSSAENTVIVRLYSLAASERSLDDIVEELRALPIPQDLLGVKAKVQNRVSEARSVTLSWNGHVSSQLPMWAIGYWESLDGLREDIMWWKKAKSHLRQDFDQSTRQTLSTIPWDGKIPADLGCRMGDLAVLSTNEWLTGTQLDMLAWYFNSRLPPTSRIMRTIDGQVLIRRYRNGQVSEKFETPPYLKTVGQELRDGTLAQVGLCVNVKMGGGSELPGPSAVGNHWVAVVVDVPRCQVLFGDSEGYPAPAELLLVLRSWLGELFDEEFRNGELVYNRQPTNWCCGDQAINMIAYHFDHNVVLTNSTPISVKQYRRRTLRVLIDCIRGLVSNIQSASYPFHYLHIFSQVAMSSTQWMRRAMTLLDCSRTYIPYLD